MLTGPRASAFNDDDLSKIVKKRRLFEYRVVINILCKHSHKRVKPFWSSALI